MLIVLAQEKIKRFQLSIRCIT